MAVRLAQASHDENGAYHNGLPGNQSGDELNIRAWYNRPWDTIIRPIDRNLAKRIADTAQRLVRCVRIGYDMNLTDRLTLYGQCEQIGWDITRINEIMPCECDCSALVTVVLRFNGISIYKGMNTSGLTAALQPTGLFEILRDEKYLTGDAYLMQGDIVLNTWHHVAICLDNGSRITNRVQVDPYWVMTAVNSCLQVRTGPGRDYPEFMVSDGSGGWTSWRYPPNAQIRIVEEADGWGRVGDTIGWVSLAWCRKI